jgi:Ni,Fe-hydrogenase III large subunit
MQSFRIREPVMKMAEQITGNRKTYGLCVIGGVRWDITPSMAHDISRMCDLLEAEWREVADAVSGDSNMKKRGRGVGLASPQVVKDAGLIGPMARASGVVSLGLNGSDARSPFLKPDLGARAALALFCSLVWSEPPGARPMSRVLAAFNLRDNNHRYLRVAAASR